MSRNNDNPTQGKGSNQNRAIVNRDANQQLQSQANLSLSNFNSHHSNNQRQSMSNEDIQREISAFLAANSSRHNHLVMPSSQNSGVASIDLSSQGRNMLDSSIIDRIRMNGQQLHSPLEDRNFQIAGVNTNQLEEFRIRTAQELLPAGLTSLYQQQGMGSYGNHFAQSNNLITGNMINNMTAAQLLAATLGQPQQRNNHELTNLISTINQISTNQPTVNDQFGFNADLLLNANSRSMNNLQGNHINPNPFPCCIAIPDDKNKLSDYQQFLRYQIEAFQATEEDVHTHVRGRNKSIMIGQIGFRCRHCAHIPVSHRQKGSTYFPSNTMGIYQAAQNMSTAHIQCGLCPFMPPLVKEHFKSLIATKASTTGAGRVYWAEKAKEMGMIDTPNGIFFSGVVR